MTLRIANAAGFLGDSLDAPRRLVQAAEVDYLTLEYLAELTMSILARSREKDPRAGYARDFIEVLQDLAPLLARQPQLRIVTNAGGVNPRECARAAAEVLVKHALPDASIAVVSGDDLLPRLAELQKAGARMENMETGQPLSQLTQPVVGANAYLGASPIAEALAGGAQIVITGRVADASLALGPAVYTFGWQCDDWNTLAGGTVAGHLIECGAQVTGAYSVNWRDRNLKEVGYPIAELSADGSSLITKPDGSGGCVTRHTVIEQLVYEIGDPAHYLTPDVDVDFTTVEVKDLGGDRVQVRGATGRPAPDSYKVSLAYQAGFAASGQLLVYGHDAVDKARACADMILHRVRRAGFDLAETNVELLGAGEGVPGGLIRTAATSSPPEVMLRLSAADPRREAIERFAREFAPLITSGPAGLAGYAAGRIPVRGVLAYWPTLIAKELVPAQVEVRPAKEWNR